MMEKAKLKFYGKKLENWTKEELFELAALYSLSLPSNLKKKEEFVKFILEEYFEKIEEFFNNLQKLEEKKISLNKAKDLFKSRYKLSLKEIRKIKKRHHLLFLIYKHWRDKIDEILEELSFFGVVDGYDYSSALGCRLYFLSHIADLVYLFSFSFVALPFVFF